MFEGWQVHVCCGGGRGGEGLYRAGLVEYRGGEGEVDGAGSGAVAAVWADALALRGVLKQSERVRTALRARDGRCSRSGGTGTFGGVGRIGILCRAWGARFWVRCEACK